MPYKFLVRSPKLVAFQPNTWDCGLCWCFFIYDTMLALHHRVYMVKPSGNADATHYFGHHIHSKDYTDRKRSLDQEKKKVTTPLCKLWHYEMIRTIERLRWCFLSSRHCDITRPNDWGVTTKAHSDLITSKLFEDNVKPVINMRKIPTRSKVNALYAKEKTARLKVTKGDKFPALHPRPSLLLDVKRYAEWLLQEVLPSGTLSSKFQGMECECTKTPQASSPFK